MGQRRRVGVVERVVFATLLLLLHLLYGLFLASMDVLRAIPFLLAGKDDTLLPSACKDVKVPQHLAVVFPLPPPPTQGPQTAWTMHKQRRFEARVRDVLEDVLRLATWCALLRTKEFSVYDPQGTLQRVLREPGNLQLYVPDAVRAAPHASCIQISIHAGREADRDVFVAVPDAALAAFRQATHIERPHLRLNALGACEDKPAILRAAHTPNAAHDPKALRAALLAQDVLCSDPDLVVVSGCGMRPIQLYGFPCWSIRIADVRYVVPTLTQDPSFLHVAWPLDGDSVSRYPTTLCTLRAALWCLKHALIL